MLFLVFAIVSDLPPDLGREVLLPRLGRVRAPRVPPDRAGVRGSAVPDVPPDGRAAFGPAEPAHGVPARVQDPARPRARSWSGASSSPRTSGTPSTRGSRTTPRQATTSRSSTRCRHPCGSRPRTRPELLPRRGRNRARHAEPVPTKPGTTGSPSRTRTSRRPQRPAFISWWDYGFQAVAQGLHPTVADNFQNGIDPSGNFLLSQNESLAIGILTTTLLSAEAEKTGQPNLPARAERDPRLQRRERHRPPRPDGQHLPRHPARARVPEPVPPGRSEQPRRPERHVRRRQLLPRLHPERQRRRPGVQRHPGVHGVVDPLRDGRQPPVPLSAEPDRDLLRAGRPYRSRHRRGRRADHCTSRSARSDPMGATTRSTACPPA